MMRRCTELLILCCAVARLAAQAVAPPAPPAPSVQLHADSGAVVRLHFVTGGTMAARLLQPFAPDSTAWVYCPYGTSFCHAGAQWRRVVTPASTVGAVDVRRGSEAATGVLRGAGLGIVAGLVLCGVEHVSENGCGWSDFPGTAVPIVVGTAALGGVVGLLRPHWRRA